MTPMLWAGAVLMLLGAAMLLAGVGAAGVWIAVIAVGVAMVAMVQGPTAPAFSLRGGCNDQVGVPGRPAR
jgi:hypothetical protein